MSEWRKDPGVDTAALAEQAAKAADNLEEVRRAALAGNGTPALQLARDAVAAARKADADDLTRRINAAPDVAEIAKLVPELAKLVPADVLAPLPFGARLPRPVLWREGGGAPENAGTVLCAGELAMLSGPGEAGKSTVSIALADAARDGGTACGLHVAKARVAVLSYEDSGPRLAHRFEWYAPQDEWAHVRRARGASPLWDADPEQRDYSGPSGYWRPWWDAVADFRAGLVVIDPASVAAAGLSPNDGGAVRAFLLAVTQEAAAIGAGVLMIAHDTKSARNEARAGIGPGPGAISGSGQWSDGARTVLHLSGAGPGDKRLLVAAKSNYGPSGWGARLAPRWDGDKWRGLILDHGKARQSRERVAATRKEWATPKPDTSERRGNGVTAKSDPYAPGEVA